jgi:hypothetical protein
MPLTPRFTTSIGPVTEYAATGTPLAMASSNTSALAVSDPMPGMSTNVRLISLSRCHAMI